MTRRHRWSVVCLWTGVLGMLAVGAADAQQQSSVVQTPPEITIQITPPGDMFADIDGYALYVSERDAEPGTSSSCSDSCASEWTAVRASADAEPFGDWTLVPRDDGMPQWAYQERPLYRWAKESQRRWADGQNQNWRYALVSPFPARTPPRRRFRRGGGPREPIVLPADLPGGITGQSAELGSVFADGKGMTLYTSAASTPCVGPCLETRRPLTAPLLAVDIDATGDWTIVKRPDQTLQWAYQGKPLYRSVEDTKAGDTNGEGDIWHAVLVPSAP